jgi:hypothetical protein
MSSCNLVVYKVGNGINSLLGSAFPVSIDEINPINGAISQTLTTQFTGSSLLTQSGTGTSDGMLNSYNGYLSVPGYSSSIGTPLSSNNKANCILDGNSLVTSYLPFITPFVGDRFRSSLPLTSTSFYAVGNNGSGNSTRGLYYYNGGFSSQLVNANLRVVEAFNNQLYVSNSTNIYAIGTGLPANILTSTLPTGLLPNYPSGTANIYGFSISPDSCTMYVADIGTSQYGGVSKWKKNAGIWTWQYRYNCFSSDLTVDYSGQNNVIYATINTAGTASTANKVIRLSDNGTTSFTLDWTYTALTNYRFAGIDFTPNSYKPITITQQPIVSVSYCQNTTTIAPLSVSATSSVSISYQWYSNTVKSNTGGTLIAGATSSSYVPSTATVSNLYYYVIVTNSSGCTTRSNVSGLVTVCQ